MLLIQSLLSVARKLVESICPSHRGLYGNLNVTRRWDSCSGLALHLPLKHSSSEASRRLRIRQELALRPSGGKSQAGRLARLYARLWPVLTPGLGLSKH